MKKSILAVTLAIFAASAICQENSHQSDSIYKNFLNPPETARLRVWWHWMNGNITKDGIRKDLEWMKRSGIGGFQNFDAAFLTPQIVEKRLVYMSPDWKDAFRFTTRLADSLHLEMAIAGSPGWSESGGPWVKPEDGMKKIVWTETRVQGGISQIKLPAPPSTTGPFQNLPKTNMLAGGADKLPSLYKDILVIAYPLPSADRSPVELQATISSSGGHFTLEQLTDGNLAQSSLLPSDSINGYAWIQYAFPQAQTIKAITMVGGGDMGFFGLSDNKDGRILEASEDGQHFNFVSYIPAGRVLQQTVSVTPTTAKYFRIRVKNPPAPSGLMAMFGGSTKPPPGTEIAELVLHSTSRVNMFEEKDAFAPAGGLLYEKATVSSEDAVSPNSVIELTDKLNPDETLNWTAPSGEWMVIRFGYTLTGMTNSPASKEATGLEVDKLDPAAINRYFTNYLDQYKDATGGLMGKHGGLQFMVNDSWEAGTQNWTANFPAEFQKRRGYSMNPWMPVLAGHLVKSAEASDQFLYDFRKTLSELVVAYHYDNLTDILANYGMKRYTESHEDRRAFIADGMEVKRKAAIPMSAMWTPSIMNGGDQTDYMADIFESASVAHIYGQNLVAAESLTALGVGGNAWAYSPENLKPTADLELACGLNRFVIHTSVHQPTDDKLPGLGLGPFGQWFNRHDTWADQAGAWSQYLGRSSYLLQQGKFVADIVYYYGEDNNITSIFNKKLPEIPEGYKYDFINSDALINLLSVKDGKLVTPSGMEYRMLVLDSNARKIPITVLKKINLLAKAGAMITGIRPIGSPSLSDSQEEFDKLVRETWEGGHSSVSSGIPLREVLEKAKVSPDFSYSKPKEDSKLLFVHRRDRNRDIYWINNRNDRDETIDAGFRVDGRKPELWHPENGKTESLSYSMVNGHTQVKLHLTPQDAVFVVFDKKTTAKNVKLKEKQEKELAVISGSWQVSFQPDRGAPASASFDELKSYTSSGDLGIKYFSGTASYTKTIKADQSWQPDKSGLWLDLGDVKNLAEVLVNGKSLGIVWKKPFRIDVGGALKAGDNRIEVRVTNLWVNRLIGDTQPGAKKLTFTTMPFYQANSPLQASGLLGPVRILALY